MYKTLYMSLVVLYGGEGGFAGSPTSRKNAKQTVYQLQLITTKFFKLPIMWVYISCHLKLNYLFNKNNPILVIVSTDRKEMWQKKMGTKTQYSYSDERKHP